MILGLVIKTWRVDCVHGWTLTLYGLDHLCRFSIRSEQTPGCPVGVGGTDCCRQRPHMFGVRDNTQTYTFLPFLSGVRLRDSWPYYVEQSTQKPSVVFCIFRILSRIRGLIKWVLTDCVLSHPATYMLCLWGYSHLQLFDESRVTMFLEIFERITSHEDKEFTPLWPVVSIFPQSIFIWKTCQPTYVYFSMTYAKKQMCHKTIISLWWN